MAGKAKSEAAARKPTIRRRRRRRGGASAASGSTASTSSRRPRRRRRRTTTGGGGPANRRSWPKRVRDTGIGVLDLLALAHAVYLCDGWRSSKRAGRRGGKPSWEIVYAIHEDFDAFEAFRSAHPGFRVTKANEDAAAAILAWSQDPAVDDLPIADYRRGLKAATARDEVSGKNFSLVCSAVEAFMRDSRPPGELSRAHVGAIGKREIFTLRLRRVSAKETRFGPSFRLEFADVDGNAVIWFSTKSPTELGIAIESTYAIKATVTEHDDFNGSLQTKISRGRVA